jgi:hypothetical protein
LLGKYRTPRFRISQKVRCQVLGKVVITGIAEAPILLPIAKNKRGRLWLSQRIHDDRARGLAYTIRPFAETRRLAYKLIYGQV